MSDLVLAIEGKDWILKTIVEPSDGPTEFAKAATSLYQEHVPSAPADPIVELDTSLYCERRGVLDFYIARIRFAKQPARGGKPRWSRWHDLTVERAREATA